MHATWGIGFTYALTNTRNTNSRSPLLALAYNSCTVLITCVYRQQGGWCVCTCACWCPFFVGALSLSNMLHGLLMLSLNILNTIQYEHTPGSDTTTMYNNTTCTTTQHAQQHNMHNNTTPVPTLAAFFPGVIQGKLSSTASNHPFLAGCVYPGNIGESSSMLSSGRNA